MSKIDLGAVSSYAIAVQYGYQGTEAEWMANIMNASDHAETATQKAQEAAESASDAQQSALAASTNATASKADYTQVMDDFDLLSARMNEMTAISNGYVVDELWTGDEMTAGAELQLAHDVNDYDYIDVFAYFYGWTSVFTGEGKDGSLNIRDINLSDSSATSLWIGEIKLTFEGDIATINFNNVWSWSGSSSANAAIQAAAANSSIVKICGRKVKVTEETPELADIRIGYDGTEYASAGEAVRTQIQNLADAIAEIRNGL